MEATAYKKEKSLIKLNGKPVVDGRFLLVLKNPVSGFVHKVFIAGSRGSVYTAILSFARDQWMPPLAVEHRVVNTRLPEARFSLKENLKAALSTD